MRRALPLLAIIASSVLFLAATPSPASAGNCINIGTSAVYYQSGLWYFDGVLDNCYGVTAAQMQGKEAGNLTNITDLNTGIVHVTGSLSITYPQAQITYAFHPFFSVWGSGCGSPPFNAAQYWGFRIKSGSTWGPWHSAGPRRQFLC